MIDEPYVTRRELDLLKAEADRQREELRAKINAMDAGGTRGIGVLQLQISDLAKDFARHEEQHAAAEARRTSARRWAAATVIAVIAAIDGPMVTILLARR